MLRWLRRKILFCCIVFAGIYYINQTHPEWFQALGKWIGGEVGNRVSLMVSNFFDNLQDSGIREAVEVFREGLQG